MFREVCINVSPEQPRQKYCTNAVVTSKYTVWNFIPKNLVEQFKKVSNVYFLLIAILQTLPPITTTSGVPTLAFPLSIVLIVNATKDIYEDWRRHKSDAVENAQRTYVVPYNWTIPSGLRSPEQLNSIGGRNGTSSSPGSTTPCRDSSTKTDVVGEGDDDNNNYTSDDDDDNEDDEEDEDDSILGVNDPPWMQMLPTKMWKDIQVGDLVICRNRDVYPADVVLLASSDAYGIAFVETASLDGETNLKLRQATNGSLEILGHQAPESIYRAAQLQGRIECNLPDANLSAFNGVLYTTSGTDRLIDSEGQSRPEVHGDPGSTKVGVPLGPPQLLLRGCKLRNTSWTVGVAVYTGQQTKIQQNLSGSPHKVSRVEKLTNTATYIVFGIQLTVCLVGAVATWRISSDSQNKSLTYLGLSGSPAGVQAVNRFFTWLVLFCNFIPISLIVTMGMVKAVQAFFIGSDASMYYSPTKTYAAPRTSDLNEELGQVEHVFTDKTGTLTCNCMEFRKCSIAGVTYGQGLTEIRKSVLKKQGRPVPADLERSPEEPQTPNVNFVDPLLRQRLADRHHSSFSSIFDFFLHLAINHAVVPEVDRSPGTELQYSASSPDERALTYAASHFGIKFIGRTPTGIELDVRGYLLNVQLLANVEFSSARKRSSVLCKIDLRDEKNQQNNQHNDQSLCVPNFGDGRSPRYILFCKGADTVIFERLSKTSAANTSHSQRTLQHMESFADDGLRTLCIAKRDVTKREAEAWLGLYKEAALALDDREGKIENAAEQIETNLELQGVTGIEDKLQEFVGDTLQSLGLAGIKVWMLTGDKVETAVNIGIATSLLPIGTNQLIYQWSTLKKRYAEEVLERDGDLGQTGNSAVVSVPKESEDSAQPLTQKVCSPTRSKPSIAAGTACKASNVPFSADEMIYQLLASDIQRVEGLDSDSETDQSSPDGGNITSPGIATPTNTQPCLRSSPRGKLEPNLWWHPRELLFWRRRSRPSCSPFLPVTGTALIIDGECLSEMLKDQVSPLLVRLARNCATVICCRVTPFQKGAIVSLIKKAEKRVTLAIGDGANDCSMIQNADVGVGLRGLEGMQAYNVSDYGISQFHHLRVLLLCHGRWCYRRLCKLVVYMFYKNLLLVMPIFYFAFVSLFSGQKIYFEFIYQLYNVVLTSIPIMVFGVLDQDVNRQTSLAFPQLYRLGIQNHYLNLRVFGQWIANGLFQSAIVFLVPFLTFGMGKAASSEGFTSDTWAIGQVVFLLVMLVVNFKVFIETAYLTWMTWFGVIFSIGAWFLLAAIFSSFVALSGDVIGLMLRLIQLPMFYLVTIPAAMICLSRDVLWRYVEFTFFPDFNHILQVATRDTGNCPYYNIETNKCFPVGPLSERGPPLSTSALSMSELSTPATPTRPAGSVVRPISMSTEFDDPQKSSVRPPLVPLRNESMPLLHSESVMLDSNQRSLRKRTSVLSRGFAFSEAHCPDIILSKSYTNTTSPATPPLILEAIRTAPETIEEDEEQ